MKPKISVLMAAYNAAEHIEETIQSILTQDFTNFELLVLDDGSTDKTLEIVKGFAKKDARVRVLRHKENVGHAIARLHLMKKARADIFAFHDSDDISLPNRFLWQYEILEKNPEIGIVGGAIETFNESGTIATLYYPDNDAECRKITPRMNPLPGCALMFRRTALPEILPFTGIKFFSGSEDTQIIFWIGKDWKLTNVQKPILKYRIHNSSTSFRIHRRQQLRGFILRIYFAKYYPITVKAIFQYAVKLVAIVVLPKNAYRKMAQKTAAFLRRKKT